MSFKVGDQVELKSGGPTMTVYYVNDDMVGCIWFTNASAEKPCSHSFQVGTLKVAT